MQKDVPFLLCIGGLPGVGKSTVAEMVGARRREAVMICPDRMRAEILGKDVIGDADLAPAVTDRVIAEMIAQAGLNLAVGRSVIVPSAFVRETMRRDFAGLAAGRASFCGVWLDADVGIIRERAAGRMGSGEATVSRVSPDYARLSLIEGVIAWPHIRADRAAEDIAAEILSILERAAEDVPGMGQIGVQVEE